MERDALYRVVESRDPRFDGRVYLGVTSTGIYCRPSCPAASPKREHMRFYRTAAAAQRGGFRACKRCRPDASPGSPDWNVRSDTVARAMRLISDGLVDRHGVCAVADAVGYSERHLTRILTDELGAGPLAIARAQRAQTARTLIETTTVPFAEVSYAAGFRSIRQFNDTVRDVFARTPSELRRRAGQRDTPEPGAITLRLAYRAPLAWPALVAFLATRAVAGVEDVRGGAYRRVLDLAGGSAVATIEPHGSWLRCTLRLDDLRDLTQAVATLRRLLDLDADPDGIDAALGRDRHLARLVAATPGLRVPGSGHPHELAIRAVLGQQISVAAARTLSARLVARAGIPLASADGALTHRFPTADAVAGLCDADLPLPARRRVTLRTLAERLAAGAIDLGPGADRAAARRDLVTIPGVGPWTAEYIAMRALNDPDAWLATDLGVRHALTALGAHPSDAERWRPWRAYATLHLWSCL
jgi:AraC family transcriptional regulator, regulatory protein of adaptative response / DNA-3-methyladenine glycosylase II